MEKRYTDPETGKFAEGNPGGGRPKGSISVITRLKQIFQENPDDFEAFIRKYKENPMNEKHIVEMIDGKPKMTIGGGEDEEGKEKPILVKFLQ